MVSCYLGPGTTSCQALMAGDPSALAGPTAKGRKAESPGSGP